MRKKITPPEKSTYIDCANVLKPIRDALDVLSGKWKLAILISIAAGNIRFREIERSVPKLTTKILAKELKDLEQNKLVKRTVYSDSPIVIAYTLTKHAKSLRPVFDSLKEWGEKHRKEIMFKES